MEVDTVKESLVCNMITKYCQETQMFVYRYAYILYFRKFCNQTKTEL